jgi:DNA-binding CsgD family transcriptional regulator
VPYRMSELEQELQELGGDITAALEELRVPAGVVDREGTIRWENDASRGRYGSHVEKPVSTLIAPKTDAQVEAMLAEMLCHGEPAEFTVQVTLPDGSTEQREISAVPLRDGGSIVGVFGLNLPAGERVVSKAAAPHSDLTERQREVLALLAEGRSTSEIAAELGLSVTTVRNHIANLIAALGVHTRLQAVIAAGRAGLISTRSTT